MFKFTLKIKILLLSLLSLFQTNLLADTIDKYPKVNNVGDNIVASSENNVEKELMKNFDNYESFEESIEPENQFINLFGPDGFNDKKLKKSVFSLWKTFNKELSKQVGSERLNGTDINNTFNESLNSLSK